MKLNAYEASRLRLANRIVAAIDFVLDRLFVAGMTCFRCGR